LRLAAGAACIDGDIHRVRRTIGADDAAFFQARHRTAFMPRHAQAVDLCGQRGHPLVVAELAFALQKQPAAKTPGQRRLFAGHASGVQRVDFGAAGFGQFVLQQPGEMLQRTLIGRVRHDQRAFLAEINRLAAAFRVQLGDPARPQLHRTATELKHHLVRHRQFRQRREHGCRRHRGGVQLGALAHVKQRNAATGAQQPPGQGAARQTGTRNTNVKRTHSRFHRGGRNYLGPNMQKQASVAY
jgi:hypothetical protein